MTRLPPRVYWALYAILVMWFIVAGLHFVRTSIWVPIFLMTVLDWVMTRDSQLRYVLSAFLMLAVFALFFVHAMVLDKTTIPFYEVGLLLAAFAAYQVLLWRVVLRRRT